MFLECCLLCSPFRASPSFCSPLREAPHLLNPVLYETNAAQWCLNMKACFHLRPCTHIWAKLVQVVLPWCWKSGIKWSLKQFSSAPSRTGGVRASFIIPASTLSSSTPLVSAFSCHRAPAGLGFEPPSSAQRLAARAWLVPSRLVRITVLCLVVRPFQPSRILVTGHVRNRPPSSFRDPVPPQRASSQNLLWQMRHSLTDEGIKWGYRKPLVYCKCLVYDKSPE